MDYKAAAGMSCIYSGAYCGTLQFPAEPPAHSFLFPSEGQIQAQADGLSLSCPPGAYLYLPAGCEAKLTIRCSQLILTRIAPEALRYPVCFGPASVYNDPAVGDVFHALAGTAGGAGLAAVFSADAQLLRLFAIHDALARAAGKDGWARIAPGAALLEQEFLRSEPISRYAQACSMGETRFRTLFTQCYGLSPGEYRIRLRLERAQTLIKAARLPIHTAAQAAGFHSVSYFCRLYRQTYGRSPSDGEEDIDA